MSIQSEIERLQGVKTDIRNAIILKGVDVSDDTPFTNYADKILQISESPIEPNEPAESIYYYGVKIDKTNTDPESSVEYIGDAVGFPSGYNFWKHIGLIQQIRPCVLKDGKVKYYLDRDNFSKKSDGSDSIINDIAEGDIMIEFPRIGYKMEFDEQYQYIWITNAPDAEGYCYDAFSLDSSGDCDRLYIGAYLTYLENGVLYSVSGKTPESSTNLNTLREYVNEKGTGYQLYSFYPETLIQCIYTIMYKSLNSQLSLGQGFTASSNASKTNTGGSDDKGFCYGETTGTEQIKFLGLEDLWGNLYQYIDGCKTDAEGNILTDYNEFSNDSYKFSHVSGLTRLVGYTNEIQGTNISGFIPKIIGNGAGSTKRYCDYGILLSPQSMRVGGNWNYGYNAYSGIYMMYLNITPNSYLNTDTGSRIVYKRKTR